MNQSTQPQQELHSWWMPFTSNRQFRASPMLLSRAEGMFYYTPEGQPVLEAPTLWLFGNEGQGLDEHEKGAADYRVAVPLYGVAESLNVGTASTVCLYASARAQR